MGKEQKPTDVFMQFATLEGVWPGVTTGLTEAKLKTGLSIRGGLMWLVHMVELITTQPSVSGNRAQVSLSVREDLVTTPRLSDAGCIAEFMQHCLFAASGRSIGQFPKVAHFLPPVPLAAPNLSLYWVSSADDVALDGLPVIARVGYTTSPLDARSYAEIAETWAYV